MRQSLNSLYVTTQGAWLACDGQSVDVRAERNAAACAHPDPLQHRLLRTGFGQLRFCCRCAEDGVKAVFLLTEHGRFLARVEGPVSGNVLPRRRQYRWG